MAIIHCGFVPHRNHSPDRRWALYTTPNTKYIFHIFITGYKQKAQPPTQSMAHEA